MKREIRIEIAILCTGFCLAVFGFFITIQSSVIVGGSVHVGPADIYPKVPGAINTAVTQANIQKTICVSGWTASERPGTSYTTPLKIKQIKQYAYTNQTPAAYEEDHLISLELGGNPTDPNNLWPEPYTTSIPTGGARFKDQVENYLRKQVCNGSMTLTIAQHAVSTDWYKVYVDNIKGKYGSVDTYPGALLDEDDEYDE